MNNTSEDVDTTMLEVRRIKRAMRTEIRLSFGTDRHYDIAITVDPEMRDSHAKDGTLRPGAAFCFGGISPPDDEEDPPERTAWRAFNEDELRWISKACLTAAGALRRIESQNRRKGTR